MAVQINEVGLRDGLQNQKNLIATEHKLKLASLLLESGVKNFEVTSFVNPKRVPQMADAVKFSSSLPKISDVTYTALIPNLLGFEKAVEAGFTNLALVLGATDTFNLRNIRMNIKQIKEACRKILALAKESECKVRVYVACACACPYEGNTPISVVHDLSSEMLENGASQISIADTVGAGTPFQISNIISPLVSEFGADRFNLHVHDTRGQGAAMAWAAYLCGIRSFDSSVGGLGGCPFAPGAAGNLATEDLVYMFNASGIETGINLEKLLLAVNYAEQITKIELGGKTAQWLRSRNRLESNWNS